MAVAATQQYEYEAVQLTANISTVAQKNKWRDVSSGKSQMQMAARLREVSGQRSQLSWVQQSLLLWPLL